MTDYDEKRYCASPRRMSFIERHAMPLAYGAVLLGASAGVCYVKVPEFRAFMRGTDAQYERTMQERERQLYLQQVREHDERRLGR